MDRSRRRTRLVLPTAALVAATVVACSSSSAAPGSTVAAASTTTSTTINTVPIATLATTTTITPVPITATGGAPIGATDLVLTAGGLGPITFGTSDRVVIAGLEVLLGSPISDVRTAYGPITQGTDTADVSTSAPTGTGNYVNGAGDEQYSHVAGRLTCWGNGLCAQFGGDAFGSLVLTGWHMDAGSDPKLATANGVRVGALWSDVEKVVQGPKDACDAQAAFTDGSIRLAMVSTGTPFNHREASGQRVADQPDPKQVVVMWIEGGDVAASPFLTC